MSGKPQYDWPSDAKLEALVGKFGQQGAADQIGVSRPGLQSRLRARHLKTTKDKPAKPVAPVDAMQRVADLCSNDS